MTPGGTSTGSAYLQELLVTHEVGHIIGAEEDFEGLFVCWLFDEVCGPSLMASMRWTNESAPVFRFNEDDALSFIGPLLKERLKPY
jgi:hypothetical protein